MLALEWFQQMVAVEHEQRSDFLLAHPVLFSLGQRPQLAAWADALSEADRETALRLLYVIGSMYERFAADLSSYPFGFGPLEQVWKRVDTGEISLDEARAQAGWPSVYGLLSPLYVEMLSERSQYLARRGDWRAPTQLQRILLSALEARPDDADQREMWVSAVRCWIDIATRAVQAVPDGRVFYDARSRGNTLAEEALTVGDQELGAELLYRLGVLHLDPYISGRTSTNYGHQLRHWRESLHNEYGNTLLDVPDDELYVPAPADALATAADYLRRSAELRQGVGRGHALKALVEALVWQTIVAESPSPVDTGEVARLARDALNLLDPESDQQHCLTLMQYLDYLGEDSTSSETAAVVDPDGLLREPLPDIVTRLGVAETIELFRRTAGVLRDREPQQALDLWERIRPLVTEHGDEAARDGFAKEGILLIGHALADPALSADPQGRSLAELAEQAQAQADRELWPEERLAATLVSLATWGPKYDQEDAAWELLGRVGQVAPDWVHHYRDVIEPVAVSLDIGRAVNALHAGQPGAAVQSYCAALRRLLNLQRTTAAMSILRRLEDLSREGDEEVAKYVVAGLAETALPLSQHGGRVAEELLQLIYRETMANMARDQRINPVLLVFFWQLAKGLAFSAALAADRRYDWRDDPEASQLLQQIAAAELSAGSDDPTDRPLLNDNELLTAYTGLTERQSGQTARQVLQNLQHRFDAHLHLRLTENSRLGAEFLHTPEQLQTAIDSRTVVLSYYIGASPQGELAIYILFITREQIGMTYGRAEGLPSATILMSADDRSVTSNWLSLSTAATREAILDEPGPRTISGEAAESLASDASMFLGGTLPQVLADFRKAGKDHLCIIPHGPLHYYPFHLLGPEDQPLAEDWIVTYLPSLQLLRAPRPAADAGRRHEVAALGHDFAAGNRHRLFPLPDAVEEARQIAASWGGPAFLNQQATEAAFQTALCDARRVHVASHGRHNVTAPAFQCVYLEPTADSNGMLQAYELLAQDLHGVDLVTLSACESALGRFDLSDNLRGLPATLLLCGVGTVVGAMWETETTSAVDFFTRFYEQLHGGASKLDAFSAAQRFARERHPQYRDWGAFFYLGRP